MLPNMIRQHSEGRLSGKGRKIPQKRARKMCKVCCDGFDCINTTEDVSVSPGICERCQKSFDSGYIAITSGDFFAFVKCPALQDLAGQIVEISKENFEKIKKQFALNVLRKKEKDEPPEGTSTVVG